MTCRIWISGPLRAQRHTSSAIFSCKYCTGSLVLQGRTHYSMLKMNTLPACLWYKLAGKRNQAWSEIQRLVMHCLIGDTTRGKQEPCSITLCSNLTQPWIMLSENQHANHANHWQLSVRQWQLMYKENRRWCLLVQNLHGCMTTFASLPASCWYPDVQLSSLAWATDQHFGW